MTEFIHTLSGCQPRQVVERRDANVSRTELVFGAKNYISCFHTWRKTQSFFFVIYTDNMIVGLLLPEISPLYGEPNIIFTCWTVNRRCVSSHIYHDFPFFCPCPANVILVFSAFRHLKDGCRLVLLSVVTMANWVWLTQSLRVTCQSRASQVFFYVSEQQYRPSRSHSRHGAAVHIEGRIINWPAVGWIWLLLCESGLNRSVGHTLGVI